MGVCLVVCSFFLFKQETAYEMRISDWSSDVCASDLGVGALAGFLAAKHAMEKHGLGGRLKFFGEPAEKVRGSKPLHAASGYYDDLDAAISFHPFYMLPLCNTVRWDTHCGAAYALIYSFTCDRSEEHTSELQ